MDDTITLSRKSFWFIKGIILFLLLVIELGGSYFYGEYVRNKTTLETYNKTRQEFIEQYRSVRFELQGTTYCYDPHGGLTREAVYKGNNLYRVKP